MTPGILESVDRRVLGGFIFVDAITNSSIENPLPVTSAQLAVKVNRSGVYAIFNGPGFTALTNQFIPATPWPAAQTLEISVSDPSLRYLARRAQIQAPQSLAGVFTPQQVPLYPGPSGPVELNWAVVRVSVASNAGVPLPWAVVRVLLADNSVAATGMTDTRGEALLAVTGLGIQVTSTATDPVTESATSVTVQAWFDPGMLTQPQGWIPNPDVMLGNLSNPSFKTGTQTGALEARETLYAQITISV
ncbi:MAG TPA: hypothetical protein VGK48_20220 [Terriglobia bacterium]|jgi:hypothetical protein